MYLPIEQVIALMIGVTLLVYIPLSWYYDRELDKYDDEVADLEQSFRIRQAIEAAPPDTYAARVNHDKDRSLAGKARRNMRKSNQRAERAALDRFRPAVVITDVSIDDHMATTPVGDIVTEWDRA